MRLFVRLARGVREEKFGPRGAAKMALDHLRLLPTPTALQDEIEEELLRLLASDEVDRRRVAVALGRLA